MSARAPIAPLSTAEVAFCREIAQLAKRHRIPLARAVELFGYITNSMIAYDKEKRGADPEQAALAYIEAFLAGMGVGHTAVKLEVEQRHLND